MNYHSNLAMDAAWKDGREEARNEKVIPKNWISARISGTRSPPPLERPDCAAAIPAVSTVLASSFLFSPAAGIVNLTKIPP
ncbi:MAG: hypothetical protein VST68_10700 [Nitrospirota bacterium]|nr:hypothetical protein [Nitrospirota bacterium]